MRLCLPRGPLKFWGMLKDGILAAREQRVLLGYGHQLTLKPFPGQTQYDLRRPELLTQTRLRHNMLRSRILWSYGADGIRRPGAARRLDTEHRRAVRS